MGHARFAYVHYSHNPLVHRTLKKHQLSNGPTETGKWIMSDFDGDLNNKNLRGTPVAVLADALAKCWMTLATVIHPTKNFPPSYITELYKLSFTCNLYLFQVRQLPIVIIHKLSCLRPSLVLMALAVLEESSSAMRMNPTFTFPPVRSSSRAPSDFATVLSTVKWRSSPSMILSLSHITP